MRIVGRKEVLEQEVLATSQGQKPVFIVLYALPERSVTVHSGDMGYTVGAFAESAKCPWLGYRAITTGGW